MQKVINHLVSKSRPFPRSQSLAITSPSIVRPQPTMMRKAKKTTATGGR